MSEAGSSRCHPNERPFLPTRGQTGRHVGSTVKGLSMEKVWAAAAGEYKDGVPGRPCKSVARIPRKGKQGLKEVPWAGEQEQGRQPLYLAALATWGQVCLAWPLSDSLVHTNAEGNTRQPWNLPSERQLASFWSFVVTALLCHKEVYVTF